MEHVINWVWQGGAVAVMTLAALRLMERMRAHARHAVCWLSLITIALLPVLPFGLGATGVTLPAPAATAAMPVLEVPAAWWASTAAPAAALGVWFALALFRIAVASRAARRTRAGSAPFPRELESRLRCWSAVRDTGRRARLVLSADVRAASVIGAGRPIIAVSPVLLSQLTPGEIDRIVIHEWAHVQRRDDFMGVLHGAIRAIAGWHPAVWLIERQMLMEREVACDETAVAVTGCPKRYAACLTTVAELRPAVKEPLGALGVLSTPALTRRVVRILSMQMLASSAASTGAAALAVLALMTFAFALTGYRVVRAEGLTEALGVNSQLPTSNFQLEVVDRTGGVLTAMATRTRTRGPVSVDRRPAQEAVNRVASPLPTVESTPAPAAGTRAVVGDSSVPGTAEVAAPALVPLTSTSKLPVIDTPALSPVNHADPRQPSPWSTLAGAGVSVGRGSRQAGVATASVFTRFGKKIAGSF